MSSWTSGARPLTIAILALGGEGGGVLSDWIVAAAQGAGLIAQNTSVAGVAQRTGATVYYVELFPGSAARPDGSVRDEPIMSIFPTPGEVDVVNHELVEYCGQQLEAMRQWGTNWTVHPDDLPHVGQVFGPAIATGTPYDFVILAYPLISFVDLN